MKNITTAAMITITKIKTATKFDPESSVVFPGVLITVVMFLIINLITYFLDLYYFIN